MSSSELIDLSFLPIAIYVPKLQTSSKRIYFCDAFPKVSVLLPQLYAFHHESTELSPMRILSSNPNKVYI